MVVLDAGADDILTEDDVFQIITPYNELHNVYKQLKDAGYEIEKAELTRIPKNTVNADGVAEKLFRLIDSLEDIDDVQTVYANFEVSDEIMERITNP